MENIVKDILISFKGRFVPFLKWLPELKDKKVIKADIIAWITVALVLIPQSMANAQLAGLPPYVWLYASFLPVVIASFWWSSKQLSTWPTAVVALMSANALQSVAETWTEGFILYASLLAVMVWVFQLSLWLLKLWIIVDFLSHPVVVWFTNAAAIIIWTSQLDKIFWFKATWFELWDYEHNYEKVYHIIMESFHHTDPTTFLIWVWSIALLILMKKFVPKVPPVLFTVVVFIIISKVINFQWEIVWFIPKGLPALKLPWFDIEIIKKLISTAVIVSIIWFVEAISIAKSMALKTKQWLSANQELVWQWLSNITSGFFGWCAISGSFARSAVNFSAWWRTALSSLVTWIIIWLTLLFLTPVLKYLPKATLAAVIMVAVAGLIKFRPIKQARNIEKTDAIVSVITFILTLIVAPELEYGIMAWIVLSLFFFIARSMRPKFVELSMYNDKTFKDAPKFGLETSKDVGVYRFWGHLYFANVWYFEWKLLKYIASKPDMKVLILWFTWVEDIDSSWIEVLESIADNIKKAWIKLYIARVSWKIMNAFKNSWFIEHLGEENIFSRKTDAIRHADNVFKGKLDLRPLVEYCPVWE